MHTTLKRDVEKEIDAVIEMGHCHASDYRSFLDRILPVDSELVENQLQLLKGKGHLSLCEKEGTKGTRWKWNKFPQSTENKADYYAPFVALCDELCPSEHGGVPAYWGNIHNKPRLSGYEEASKVRPDVGRTTAAQWELLREELASLTEQIDELQVCEETGDRRKADVHDLLEQLEDKFERLSVIWWMQILVPVEIRATMSNHNSAIRQLAVYMRLILSEQLDRRFVIGLVLCGSKFSVWLCDRSGLLGMDEPIDYHKYPELFVQAIIGLNTLTPEQLGLDNTMKLFKDKHRIDTISSYERSYHEALDNNGLHPYSTQWVIEITVNGKKGRYVTVRILIMPGSDNISDRATVVWEAAKFEEMDNPTQIYVIKQYWRPYNEKELIASEADLHEIAGISGRLVAHEDLRVAQSAENKEGVLDTTLGHIRKGIESRAFRVAKPYDNLFKHKPKFLRSVRTSELEESDNAIWNYNKYDLESRVCNRMLFCMWGFDVIFFKDRVELLTVILNAVEEHEQFYNRKVLHRDISMGNILIVPARHEDGYDFSKTQGHLIDFDRAKAAVSLTEPLRYKHPYEAEELEAMRLRGQEVAEDVYERVMEIISDPLYFRPYLSDALRIKGNKPPHSCASLGWPTQTSARPNFQDRQAQKVVRTGTVPFMSAEVLSKSPLTTYNPRGLPFFHDAIHDMESFFWVLLYVALTRQPGGNPRSISSYPELAVFINEIFINDLDAACLKSAAEKVEIAIGQVDPYFDFLKPFLTRWWTTLQVAYRYRAFEYETIHMRVTEILENALVEAGKLSSTEFHKETELERREEYYRDFCKLLKGDVHLSQSKRIKVERGSLRDDSDTDKEEE